MPDLRKHIVGLLASAPKTRERVAQALHVVADPTGGGRAELHFIAQGLQFTWHPLSQKVFLMHHTGQTAPDGSMIREARIIAMDIVTHGDAINAANIFTRGIDYAKGLPRPHLIEGKEKFHG